MENIELIKDRYTAEELKAMTIRYSKFRAVTGIVIKILGVKDSTLKVSVSQSVRNGRILNNSQLNDRAQQLTDFWEGKVNCVVLSYCPNLAVIDADWVKEKMSKFKLKQSNIVRSLGLDKSTVSILLSGDRGFTKAQRAMFYYYFIHFETYAGIDNYLAVAR